LLAWCIVAPAPLLAAAAVQSQSGQFLVSRAGSAAPNRVTAVLATNRLYLELEPELLVVSCERVRQAVARLLGLTAPWRGRIHVTLFPARSAEDLVTLTAERFRDDWHYRVQVPDVVERRRLMRALVEVLLLETANQHAGGRSAELPPWLAVGLTEHLLASAEVELLFPPPRLRVGGLMLSRTVVKERRRDPLTDARHHFREDAPLALQELSWPTEQEFSGDRAVAYRSSAQLFVTELLRFRNGAACFRAFLRELPQRLNWQTAFLKAFHEHFERLLDVEKWWALQVVYFTGRDLAHTWPPAESCQKLDEAIRIPVQVRTNRNDLPAARTVPLQTVITEWDFVRQTPVLRTRIFQIELVRQRVALELFSLAEGYRRTLAGYLEERDKLGAVLNQRRSARPAMQRLMEETVRQLNALDARLESYRRENPPLADTGETPLTQAGP
jgi:hypothetical protein